MSAPIPGVGGTSILHTAGRAPPGAGGDTSEVQRKKSDFGKENKTKFTKLTAGLGSVHSLFAHLSSRFAQHLPAAVPVPALAPHSQHPGQTGFRVTGESIWASTEPGDFILIYIVMKACNSTVS